MRTLQMWLIEQYAELLAAVRFLSILPLPDPPRSPTPAPARGVGEGLGYFPLAGLLIGLLLALLLAGMNLLLPPLARAALLVVALVLLTGGLHLDGLMDACDGLFGGRTRERRLEIMRDSRVGSFGVLGGASALLLKFAFFASLGTRAQIVALLCILPCARWAMVLAMSVFPSARPAGLGVSFRRAVSAPRLFQAGGTALGIALLAGHVVGVLLWMVASLTALVIGRWITRSIGGLTGDIYGAIAEMTEVVALLLLLCVRVWL